MQQKYWLMPVINMKKIIISFAIIFAIASMVYGMVKFFTSPNFGGNSATLIIDSYGVICDTPACTGGRTPLGANVVKLVNKMGHTTIKGEIVEASTTTASCIDPIGAIYNAGIAPDSSAWIATGGQVEVLYDSNGATAVQYWVGTSATSGRADASNASPPNATQHFQELGHVLETAAGGALGKIIMHHN